MKNYIASIITGILIIASELGVDNNAAYAENLGKYSGTLKQIPNKYIFQFYPKNSTLLLPDSQNLYRLWGAEISEKVVSDGILNELLKCEEVGYVYAENSGRTRIVICKFGEIDISQYLIRSGQAREICSETDNLYGTC